MRASDEEPRPVAFQHLSRWSGLIVILGGLLWILIWVGSDLAWPNHGGKTTILAFSYEDLNRLLVIPLLLLLIGWPGLLLRPGRYSGVLGRVGALVIFFGFVLLAVGQVLQFWLRGWGSVEDFTAPAVQTGWGSFLLGVLIVLVGQCLLGIALLRRSEAPKWAGWLLTVGPLITLATVVAAFDIGVAFGVPLLGAMWALLTYPLWPKRTQRTNTGSQFTASSP